MSTDRNAFPDYDTLLARAHELARAYLSSLPHRRVNASDSGDAFHQGSGATLPEEGDEPLLVVESLAREVEPGLVATAGPRYFGFVIGGSVPVALAADWLVSTWDQNAALHIMSPAVSALEATAAAWVRQLLGLPATASVGFVTGAHTANVTALAAARHEVLRRAGWDVEARGLQGAPRVTVVAGAEAHSSIAAACRLIGLGASTIVPVDADDQGRMRPAALTRVLDRLREPLIVCAQSGNVNTGAFDPLESIVEITHGRGGWVHVDGAFGLWAAAVPSLRHHTAGAASADSWTTDAHKWLNVPYDCGVVLCAHPAAHRAAMGQSAAYLIPAEGERRDPMDWVPEASRRARAVPVYAALRALGRRGLEDLVARCCGLARRMADRLRGEPGIRILNDVVLNQVLVRCETAAGDNITTPVIRRVQEAGICWLGGTSWGGAPAMRISISGWATGPSDIDRSADSIIACHRRSRVA